MMEKSADLNQRVRQPNERNFDGSASAGPKGIAATPPEYGLEVVDRESEADLPDREGDQSPSLSPTNEKPTLATASPAGSFTREKDEQSMVRTWVSQGATNENNLTNRVYYRRHPESGRKSRLIRGTTESEEWLEIRNTIVRPVMNSAPRPTKTIAPVREDTKPGAKADEPDAILENVQQTQQASQGEEHGLLVRFHDALRVLKDKVHRFITSSVQSDTKASDQQTIPDRAIAPRPTSAAPVAQTSPEGKRVQKTVDADDSVKSKQDLHNVLDSAIEIEKELRAKHPDYGRVWHQVTDDPRGERLNQMIKSGELKKRQIRRLNGKKEEGNLVYQYWTLGFEGYGSHIKKVGKKKRVTDQYVCTDFVASALKKAGYEILEETDARINIHIAEEKSMTVEQKLLYNLKLIGKRGESPDERVKGMVYALVSTNQGKEVTDFETLQRGDLLQYWMPKGTGHAVIIDHVEKKNNTLWVTFYGSNPWTHGIGYHTMPLITKGELRSEFKAAYAVRPKFSIGGTMDTK